MFTERVENIAGEVVASEAEGALYAEGDDSARSESALPVRTCLGCRNRAEQVNLIRVRATESGSWSISGLSGPSADEVGIGRSTYFHPFMKCIENGARGKQLQYALKRSFQPEQVESLRTLLVERSVNREEVGKR